MTQTVDRKRTLCTRNRVLAHLGPISNGIGKSTIASNTPDSCGSSRTGRNERLDCEHRTADTSLRAPKLAGVDRSANPAREAKPGRYQGGNQDEILLRRIGGCARCIGRRMFGRWPAWLW